MGASLSVLTGWIAIWSLEEEEAWNGLLVFFESHVNCDFCLVGPS